MSASAMAQVPAGFSALQAPPGFVRYCGGFHFHDELPLVAVRIVADHLNSVRIVHGGFLATVADTAFGLVLKRALGTPVPPITVSLTVDYLAAAREGDWLEAHVEVLKVGRSFVNASCLLKVGERPVLRASAVFTVWQGQVPPA
ncbi:PaaI family thioesterase [Pseudomonas sp. UL073]|uniref:PaaI family thioesterase n=1 Tax=Zestomonas insulae TaxID=2809017 RepID=A0ABS2IIZ4_9GAMM|nr:PaaI family thioesterase [Pseudomonas insulae]MBM7063036.1 PaaI family thioesterase [Pseudomonas insulae]